MTRPADLVKHVTEFFEGDAKTVDLWFTLPNPMLGHISADNMLELGREDKLRQFIENAVEASQPPAGL